ncbi:RING zinc finger-containing protein, partial [Reticulomyxa filosa]
LFEKKRRESEFLRKECKDLENELNDLRRKHTISARQHEEEHSKEDHRNKEAKWMKENDKTFSNHQYQQQQEEQQEKQEKQQQQQQQQQQQHDETHQEAPFITAEGAAAMISESELVSELMNAWSVEMANLLEQISKGNGLITPLANDNDNNNTLSDKADNKRLSEWKLKSLQDMAEEAKSRMVYRSKQTLEKRRTRQLRKQPEYENGIDNANEEKDVENRFQHNHFLSQPISGNANPQRHFSEQATQESYGIKRQLSVHIPPSRIVLSKLADRKDTELDSTRSPDTSGFFETHQIQNLEREVAGLKRALDESENSKILLIQQISMEMERMRGLLKCYNPQYRYRRLLDRLFDDNRYQKLLDQLSDESYQPHELDAFLAHIAHLKHQNKFR